VFLFLIVRRLHGLRERHPARAYCPTPASEGHAPTIVLELGRLSHHHLTVDLLSDGGVLVLLHDGQQDLAALFVTVHVHDRIAI
jgi:hypothetical protein